MDQDLSKIIRFHRKQSGLTQIQLFQMAGLGKNIVHEVEKGRHSIPFDNLVLILRILNIDIKFKSPLMHKFLEENADAES